MRHHHADIPEANSRGYAVKVTGAGNSWWFRWRVKHQCRRHTGHCWHALGIIDWECCMCPAETDGMPERRCKFCEVDR